MVSKFSISLAGRVGFFIGRRVHLSTAAAVAYALTSGGYASKYRPASSSIGGGNGSTGAPVAIMSAPSQSAA
jgi:hypothetical protein